MALTYEEEQLLRQRGQPASMLPLTRRVNAGGTVTNNVQPGEELGTGREVLSRALQMLRGQPDVEALNALGRQRVEQGDNAMLNAMAAQFAGPDFEAVQGQYLRRALAAQDPMKVGNYGVVAGGRFVADPYARRDTEAEATLGVGKALLDNEERMAQEERLYKRMAMGGPAPNLQQGTAFALPDGKIVQGVFDPRSGFMYQTPTGLQPVPAEARPTVPSVAGPLNQKDYIAKRDELRLTSGALNKLDNYFKTVQNTDVGFARMADKVAANAKTLFGAGLDPDELALQVADGQLQGLLGLFRETVVGPGVMTEQDAKRVLSALGGDLTALQNKQKVEELLRNLYQSKRDQAQFLQYELSRSDPYYGQQQMPITAPQTLGGSGVPPMLQPNPAQAPSGNKFRVDY